MRKLHGYIMKNWFWLALGCVLTRLAVECAYLERGYIAIGGEWCVLPVVLIIVELCRGVCRGIAEKEECQSDAGTNENGDGIPE